MNDKDGFVCNAWRGMKLKPHQTARWADWPVNHADLAARRRAMVACKESLLQKLVEDDLWCDPKIAGYWIWGMSTHIGAGLDEGEVNAAAAPRCRLSLGMPARPSKEICVWDSGLNSQAIRHRLWRGFAAGLVGPTVV